MPRTGISRQLYNWLSVDAVLLAVAWQLCIAAAWQQSVHPAASWVLGCSIWLTYMADRLYDVRGRPISELLSARHQFAHRFQRPLWKLWWTVLAIDVLIAFRFLTQQELYRGFWLLGFCLIYTGANQKFSKRFFPKELCVALIYGAGIILFIPEWKSPWVILSLMLICFFNCLSISRKETRHDRALQLNSLASYFTPWMAHGITAAACLSALLHPNVLGMALAVTACMQWTIHLNRARISIETYRLLADLALFIGPMILWVI